MLFSIQACSLGYALVAATPQGVYAVFLEDTREALLNIASHRLPGATLLENSNANLFISNGFKAIEDLHSPNDLPLDIQGSDFQKKVWQAIQSIPAGKTCHYTDIARAIGAPRAVRAVANACGQNRLAVLIPCHRILRKDGSLGGYHWGIQRKQLLLDRERALESRRFL